MIISGGSITKLGHFAPFLIIGAAVTTVGAGLIHTLDIGSTSGKWIGFQIVAGCAIGACFQVPIMAAQATVDQNDIPLATAIIMCKAILTSSP